MRWHFGAMSSYDSGEGESGRSDRASSSCKRMSLKCGRVSSCSLMLFSSCWRSSKREGLECKEEELELEWAEEDDIVKIVIPCSVLKMAASRLRTTVGSGRYTVWYFLPRSGLCCGCAACFLCRSTWQSSITIVVTRLEWASKAGVFFWIGFDSRQRKAFLLWRARGHCILHRNRRQRVQNIWGC